MNNSTVIGLTSLTLAAMMFTGVGLALWAGSSLVLLFMALGDFFVLLSLPLLKRPEVFRKNYVLLISSLTIGVLVTLVTGWFFGFQVISPGGGGNFFGYPLPWRLTDQGWLGRPEADSYDSIAFILDFFFFSGIACAVGLVFLKLFRTMRAAAPLDRTTRPLT